MATRRIDGVLREVWTSDVALNGGANEVVTTDISVSTRQLDRIQGFLIVTAAAGTPTLSAAPSVNANGRLVVTVSNSAAPGNTASWRLDVTVNQSTQQATTGATGSLWTILVLNPVLGGGPAVPQTLDDTYNVGIASANQTMTLTDAHGGGVIIDATDAGLLTPGAAFEVRASTTIATPTLLSRYGDDAVSAALQLAKARGNFGAPADAQTGDSCGTVNFTARVNGAFYDGSYIEGVCESVGGPTLRTSLNFYITSPGAPNVRFRAVQIYASGANIGETIVFGANSNVRPNGNDEGFLGGATHIWNAAFLGDAYLFHASNDAVSSLVQFSKSRGTLAVPADVQANDALGAVNFTGRINAASQTGAQIIGTVLDTTGIAGLDGALDFYASQNDASLQVARMQSDVGQSVVTFYTNPYLRPDVTNTGTLGLAINIWSAAHLGDAYLYHASDDAVSSFLRFSKARGTLGAPAVVQDNDELGSIDFYGYPVAAYTQDARIVSLVTNPAPTYRTGLNFYMTHGGALGLIVEMNGEGVAGAAIVRIYNDPAVIPNVNGTGSLGANGVQWGFAHIDTARIYVNVCLHGSVAGGGALGTAVFQNTSTMPAPQANQVYLGSQDFTVGALHAVLAISAEELVVADPAAVTHGIPIKYNGQDYYLHASLQAPG